MEIKKYLLEVIGVFVIILCAIGIFFLGFSLGSPNISNDYSSNYTYQPNITYKNMTIEQIMEIKEIMSQVKPLYLNLQDEIVFDNSNASLGNGLNGINSGNGKILVIDYQTEYNDVNGTLRNTEHNPKHLKYTICHELLHTYFTTIDFDLEEEIVKDLASALICFK